MAGRDAVACFFCNTSSTGSVFFNNCMFLFAKMCKTCNCCSRSGHRRFFLILSGDFSVKVDFWRMSRAKMIVFTEHAWLTFNENVDFATSKISFPSRTCDKHKKNNDFLMIFKKGSKMKMCFPPVVGAKKIVVKAAPRQRHLLSPHAKAL